MPVKVIVAYGTSDIDQAVAQPRHEHSAHDRALVVGIARHPKVSCWCTGVGWRGAPFTWVSAHRLKRAAEQQIGIVYTAACRCDLTDDPLFHALLHELALHGDQELWMRCDEAGRQILEQIRRGTRLRAMMDQ